VVDAGGLGAITKSAYSTAQDKWLDNDANLEKWENNSLTASERRVLVTHWVAEAMEKLRAKQLISKGFLRTGCLMTADSSNDKCIKVEGQP
jgi:hypothetical protein